MVRMFAGTLEYPGVALAMAAAIFALFAVAYDQGQLLSLSMGDASYQMNVVHEFFHDARHALAMACH